MYDSRIVDGPQVVTGPEAPATDRLCLEAAGASALRLAINAPSLGREPACQRDASDDDRPQEIDRRRNYMAKSP